ncbi:helix-turn-helix transcriptional regulator [Tropicibacter oceani]|uniref:Helix-turn-helix transcriptional regulator n=1 Tax=Tropicibacter oceani TaxID=3058420 RepID=A0ABY8QNC9_9RHOB|nr:helix-turn-helix transcriptional regulator [Tropicibacter oceani]WGW05541.1 helix-turn-helix transcriptional regulator [Tropicibacter oceani]
MSDTGPAFLTTKEVADLLRVKERKVYDLAGEGEIPHRRITGKLLFPRAELLAWIEGRSLERPAVLAGSHDPLLDWAVRESECGLALLTGGSLDGLARFARGEAALAGLHIPDQGGWNLQAVQAEGLSDCVLIHWARRARGLILSEAMAPRVAGLADLRGRRVALRQAAAGTAQLWQRLLDDAGLDAADFTVAGVARSESDAAAMVAEGQADAALGLAAMARQFGCDFLPLIDESFDLLIDRRSYFTAPVQRLLGMAGKPALTEKAATMGGYDLSDLGAVRWLSA